MYTSEFPHGWEKKVKVVNLPTPTRKGSVSQSTNPESAKKGGDSFETYFDIVPYKGGLPLIGNIVLESTTPPSAKTHSKRRSIMAKSRPSTPKPSIDAPLSNKTHGSKRKTSHPAPSATTDRRVC